ncbi:MAG: putative PLP-dependent enzyme [Limisphaerales bacterium]|nr:MAG: putative PLP-dependent enzyme [Limisphaerales bacterium]KAG0509919.1 MAG: putative PLP-dependent enzyme [Limisphaerales bacterium]TXT50610.1 MAG: putative PLP-dependent enzyme [Limisphaerales bacterium]
MAVPLFDIKPQNHALATELQAAFARVLASGQFILGPEVQNFERQCAEYLGVKHALGVSSGTDAILLALMALGIGPGDEVICPSFTFFATAGCVTRTGAKPVFCDVQADTFNLDVADAARRITPRTKAIMPVHLYGQAADMTALNELARQHGIKVIEDACQAVGATQGGKHVGSLGDFGAFSFFPTKNLGAFGDAGLLTTNDDSLARQATLLRNHGAHPKYYHQFVGGNFRLDAVQAALLAVKLPLLDDFARKRTANAARYTEHFARLPGVGTRLLLPTAWPGNGHTWNQYTLRLPGAGRREALREWLAARQIGTEIYYPVPLHAQACFAAVGQTDADLPVSARLAGEVLSIPIFPELTLAQQDEVIAAVGDFLAAGK